MRKSLALVSLLALAACTKNDATPSAQSFPSSKIAPSKASDTFKSAPDGSAITGTNGSSITIRKTSLGKAFLMTTTVTDSGVDPSPDEMLPKVVTFEMNGTEVGLLEQSIYSIYDDVPTGKVLQSFPVDGQDADTVTFKWSYGLSSVPKKPFYVSADEPGTVKQETNAAEPVFPVVASYLKFAKIEDNRLLIRQLMRVRGENMAKDDDTGAISSQAEDESVQLDIAFTPYVPNPRFHAKLSLKLNGIGYFDIASVRKGDGTVDLYSSHWDLSPEAGPITYAISKSAPAETVAAIKDGVEYWNRVSQAALGRDIVTVVTGADPQAPIKPRTVLIYYVADASSGAAFANFSPDPLTGEITSGFIYMPSVFYADGNRGRRYVDRGDESNRKPHQFVAFGFKSSRICDLTNPPLAGLDPLAGGTDMDDKIAKKMGLDRLRSTVAHESGHTLGLRHNFAGTVGSEVPNPAAAADLFAKYLTDVNSQGAITSSSIMDYTTFRDDVLQGAALGAKRVLPYDKDAITWAYGDKDVTPASMNTPYFCTDNEGGGLGTLGCAEFDTGQHPLLGHAWEAQRNKLLASDIVIETLTDGIRADNQNDAMTVSQALAATHPDLLSKTLAAELPNVMRIGGVGMKAIQVDRAEGGVNWSNQADYIAQTKAAIAKEFDLAGGLPGILKTAYNLDDKFHAHAGWLLAAAHQKESKPGFGKGKTMAGTPYQLSAQEIKDVKTAADKLGAATESAILRDSLLAVTGLDPFAISQGKGAGKLEDYMSYPDKMSTYDPDVVQDSWQSGLDALASQLASETTSQVAGTVDGKAVRVPVPNFTLEERVAAMRLYSPKVFGRDTGTWMSDQSSALAKTLAARLAPVITMQDGDPSKAQLAGKDVSDELQAWAETEMVVYVALWTARH